MKPEITRLLPPKPERATLTVRIDAELKGLLKAEAAASGRTETEILEAALRWALVEEKKGKR